MPVIVKLPSGNWRAQVRRKGSYISNSFRRRADAESWALEAERTIDKGLVSISIQTEPLIGVQKGPLFVIGGKRPGSDARSHLA